MILLSPVKRPTEGALLSNDGEWSFKHPFVCFPSDSGTGSLDSLVNYRVKDVAASSEFLIFLKTLPPVDPDVITILPFHTAPLCDAKKPKNALLIVSPKGVFLFLLRKEPIPFEFLRFLPTFAGLAPNYSFGGINFLDT